jgi:hypothetical protein
MRKGSPDFCFQGLTTNRDITLEGLVHLVGQNFGQAKGGKWDSLRRGNSFSYGRGTKCFRCPLAADRKLTEKVNMAEEEITPGFYVFSRTKFMKKRCMAGLSVSSG